MKLLTDILRLKVGEVIQQKIDHEPVFQQNVLNWLSFGCFSDEANKCERRGENSCFLSIIDFYR